MGDERTRRETQAAERKAEADAAAAELDLARRQAEFAEWQAQQGKRTAEAEARLRELRLKNDEARRTAIKDVVPDLADVDRGSTTVPEQGTVFHALLGGHALQDAARKLIPAVKSDSGLGDDYRVLVTTDLDLAGRDADFRSLVTQLEHFKELVDRFLEPEAAPPQHRHAVAGLATSLAVAAAQMLPGLLSLVSARRTLSTSGSSLDDETVLMAVAGALAEADAEATVVVEKARLIGKSGEAQQAWDNLQSACRRLSLEVEVEEGEDDEEERAGEGRALLAACRSALAATATVQPGASRSALATASLQEALHSEEYAGVLVVKGGACSSTQLVDDRPLHFGDPLSVVTTATISYLLLDQHDGSRVRRGGLVHGTAQLRGTIGSELSLPE